LERPIAIAQVNVNLSRFVTLPRGSDGKSTKRKTRELGASVRACESLADNPLRETDKLYQNLRELLFIHSIANANQYLHHRVRLGAR
jgi:hypothetical protein